MFWDPLYRLTQQGVTVFVTTHYMDEAEHCENLAFIYFGRIIPSGAPHAIVAAALPEYVLTLETPDPIDSMQTVHRLKDSGRLTAAMQVKFPSLEDAFIALVERANAM